VYNKTTN